MGVLTLGRYEEALNMLKMDQKINLLKEELIQFTQNLVRTKSYSGKEESIIRIIEQKMHDLDYDEIIIDSMGNIVGRMGSGKHSIMFDSHIDTVNAGDESKWTVPPFSGEIIDGKLYGRGSVDMKSPAAASIFAGAAAKQLGLLENLTVYVACTVFEEDCDGENLKHLFEECKIRPDYYVTCEPSGNKIVTGHKGKAQVLITTKGISAHGSAPEKGKNAVYEMAEIIQRVDAMNLELQNENGPRKTLVLSEITSKSVSLNAVPSECSIYLDRRMVIGETEDHIKAQMDQLISGKNAEWKYGTIHRQSWTGVPISYEPIHMPWKIDETHPLFILCTAAYKAVIHETPKYDYWDFSTNAVTPVGMGIPSIGFGPGEYKLAHMVDEHCHVDQIVQACHFYTALIKNFNNA